MTKIRIITNFMNPIKKGLHIFTIVYHKESKIIEIIVLNINFLIIFFKNK